MRIYRNAKIPQGARTNDNFSPCQRILLTILYVNIDNTAAKKSFLDEEIRYLLPDLDRMAENGGGIESVADAHLVDGLAADCVGGGCTLRFSGGALLVAAVVGGGQS